MAKTKTFTLLISLIMLSFSSFSQVPSVVYNLPDPHFSIEDNKLIFRGNVPEEIARISGTANVYLYELEDSTKPAYHSGLKTISPDSAHITFTIKRSDVPEGVYLVRIALLGRDGVRYFSNLSEVYTGTTGLNYMAEQKVRCFPNPTSSMITLTCENGVSQTIQIFNGAGIEVFPVQMDRGDGIVIMDVSNLPAGGYVMIMKGKYTRFIKQ